MIAGDGAAERRPSGRGAGTAGAGHREHHVVFHDFGQARAALLAARPSGVRVVLRTARGAIGYAGPAYLLDLVRAAVAETASDPRAVEAALIDGRGEPALAFAALRAGWRGLIFAAAGAHRREIEAAAAHYAATLVLRPPRALDLAGHRDAGAACRRWYRR